LHKLLLFPHELSSSLLLNLALVFSCAAGIRSVHAAQFAAQNGYTKLVNYKGGANEWFN
jgi:rhodanese-related sulfurtransferase